MENIRNKMASRGVEALDDRELLALLIEDKALAELLLTTYGGSLARLAGEAEARLRMVGGLGLKRARMLRLAAEFGRRVAVSGAEDADFIATSDEAFLVMLVSDMSWLNKLVSILSMCGVKLALGAGIGYLVDLVANRKGGDHVRPLPEYDVHGHTHVHDDDEEEHLPDGDGAYTACEHAHAEKWFFLYIVSPLLHALKVAAFVLAVNLLFGFLFFFVGEDNVISFLRGSGYWYQPLICAVLGLVPNCGSSVILAEVYAMGGITFGSCLAGLIVNTGLGVLVLFRNVKDWRRNLLIVAGLLVLGIAAGYASNGVELALPPIVL